jgi:hypothetical protein
MRYQYEVMSDCGPYTGSLYISTIDSIGSDTLRKVVVCYTDDYAKHIDLYQILGVVGANRRFILCDPPVNDQGVTIADPVFDETTGILNAFESYDEANSSQTYTFCYNKTPDDVCVKNNMQITIVVTKDVKTDSEFKELK